MANILPDRGAVPHAGFSNNSPESVERWTETRVQQSTQSYHKAFRNQESTGNWRRGRSADPCTRRLSPTRPDGPIAGDNGPTGSSCRRRLLPPIGSDPDGPIAGDNGPTGSSCRRRLLPPIGSDPDGPIAGDNGPTGSSCRRRLLPPIGSDPDGPIAYNGPTGSSCSRRSVPIPTDRSPAGAGSYNGLLPPIGSDPDGAIVSDGPTGCGVTWRYTSSRGGLAPSTRRMGRPSGDWNGLVPGSIPSLW